MKKGDKFTYKIVLLGNAAVGKTNLILRYVKNKFTEDLGATIGVNFLNKNAEVSYRGQTHFIDLVIWDIGGYTLKDMMPLRQLYCRGAQAAIYVYDITRFQTFEDLKLWNEVIEKHGPEKLIRCLVANKNDLKKERQVSSDHGRKKARALKADFFFETSAKTGEKVQDMFTQLAEKLIDLASKSE